MTAYLTMFGGVAFLGALIAVHWVYFESHFFGDGRLAIRLPLTLEPGVKHLLLRPAAQGGFRSGANVGLFPAAPNGIGLVHEPSQDRAAPATGGNDLPSSTMRLQSKQVSIVPSRLLAELISSLELSESPVASMASESPAGGDRVDRMIIADSHLLLEGIVTETELVCWGNVEIGAGSVIGACMKVRGNMVVGANVIFLGSVVVNGNISTGENCVFLFDVVSKGKIFFGKGTRLGSSTNEVAIPAMLKRLTDQPDLAAGILSDSQYEMHYG